ncbi:mitochondrial proton/calcium exchanger protein-like isoform X2 [Pseudoliparis swirei]|uniref:mitochondrial proton/calcium exchanger protein-like isoform X2 n=1 Tax=Pseudoliparis swirei TaxID=2059687 RepID=UPI0024BDDE38|nr:mitochondrial proton/calcium exchanger protein-like isoform X2 [Pseudoliparis swirei]
MVAEMALSKVDNKAKLESTLKEEAAIRQDNKDREMERLADAAEKAAREGELELEAESVKADMAAHSETLRDTAPVIEGLKWQRFPRPQVRFDDVSPPKRPSQLHQCLPARTLSVFSLSRPPR